MYPYTKRLTLDEVFNAELNPNVLAYRIDSKVFITAHDYATYILNQPTPPEGWGYAAYELDSGRYNELPYYILTDAKHWKSGVFSYYQYSNSDFKYDWNRYAFKLTDLAKVEASSKMEPTESHIQPSGIKDETQNYDWEAKYNQLAKEADQWKSDRDAAVMLNKTLSDNAKNKIAELEEKLKTSKCYAENLSDKLGEAEETIKKYGTHSEVYIRAMEHKLTLLDQLKQADIEIAKASFDYYPKF